MKRLNKDYGLQKNLKNRSSKHLNLIIGQKPILRMVSLEQLKDWADKEVTGAAEELKRREARIARRKAAKGTAA